MVENSFRNQKYLTLLGADTLSLCLFTEALVHALHVFPFLCDKPTTGHLGIWILLQVSIKDCITDLITDLV